MSYFRSTFERRFRPLKPSGRPVATVMVDGKAVPAWRAKELREKANG